MNATNAWAFLFTKLRQYAPIRSPWFVDGSSIWRFPEMGVPPKCLDLWWKNPNKNGIRTGGAPYDSGNLHFAHESFGDVPTPKDSISPRHQAESRPSVGSSCGPWHWSRKCGEDDMLTTLPENAKWRLLGISWNLWWSSVAMTVPFPWCHRGAMGRKILSQVGCCPRPKKSRKTKLKKWRCASLWSFNIADWVHVFCVS